MLYIMHKILKIFVHFLEKVIAKLKKWLYNECIVKRKNEQQKDLHFNCNIRCDYSYLIIYMVYFLKKHLIYCRI